jgi:hypothetical protein
MIAKFLAGEDDPDWIVTTTKTQGKYIIKPRRPRNKPVEESEQEQDESQEQEDPEQNQDPEAKPKSPPPPKPTPPPPPKPPKYIPPRQAPPPSIRDDLAMDILTELRAIGEYKRTKEAKRLQKKEIKKQIIKHAPRVQLQKKPPPKDEYDYEEYSDEEPDEEPKPVFQRRRVSLIRT